MYSHKIEEKLLPIFARFLFKNYVERFGYSKSFLNTHEIPIVVLDPPKEFYVETPEGRGTTCVQYLSEMKALGLLTQSGGFYKFTEAGYAFGYESLHPFKTFHDNHWQWIYGTLLLGIVVAIIQLVV